MATLLQEKTNYSIDDHVSLFTENENMDNLLSYWRALKLVEPVYLLGDAAHSRGGLAVIHGWVPEAQLADVIEQLRKTMASKFHFLIPLRESMIF